MDSPESAKIGESGGSGGTERSAGLDIGEVRVRQRSERIDFSLKCDAIACDSTNGSYVMIVSVIGAPSSVRGLQAALSGSNRVEISASGFEQFYTYNCRSYAGDYRFYGQVLPHNTRQLLAIAERPGLITSLSDQSLWDELRQPKYTTPLLREWMPWLQRRMLKYGILKPLRAVGCKPAILNCSVDKLDELVSGGLKRNRISMGDYACKIAQT